MSLLSGWVYGWEHLEPVFIANIAMQYPILMVGRHGIAKSLCARQVSKIYGPQAFRYYDATKDDLVSIAGIPKPESLTRDGATLEFAKHSRTIWDAEVIVVDELTRAHRENQNLWLEILEERRLFGIPLKLKSILATMNPDTYQSTFKLDEALLDRFYAVLYIPELQAGTSGAGYKRLIELQFDGSREADPIAIRQAVDAIRIREAQLRQDPLLMDAISDYLAHLMELLHNEAAKHLYISPRKIVQLAREILALMAYFEWAKSKRDPLDYAAITALMYTLATPLKTLKPEVLEQLHQKLKPILCRQRSSAIDQLRMELARRTGEQRVQWIIDQRQALATTLPADELDKALMEAVTVAAGKRTLLASLITAVNDLSGHEEVKRKAEGEFLSRWNKDLNDGIAASRQQAIITRQQSLDDQTKAEAVKEIQASNLAELLTRAMTSQKDETNGRNDIPF